MNCEEFWEKAAAHLAEDALDSGLPSGLKGHLKECQRCQKEWELFRCGMEGLREEIQEKEPELFWIEMKNNVRANLRPPRQGLGLLKEFLNWKWALAGASLAFSLVFLINTALFYNHGPGLETQDVIAMFDPVPMSFENVQEEIESTVEGGPSKEDGYDPYILCGVSDGWSAVLDEVDYQGDLKTGKDIKKRGLEKGNGHAHIPGRHESA